MAMKCRKELLGGLHTGINTRHIVASSKMVAEYTGFHLQPHRAIVGANAFSHESGIHQDGILKYRGTYEIISPEDIGLSQSNGSGIVLGKLSGRNALRSRLVKLGYDIDGKELDDIFRRFKEVAKKKKHILDADIEELVYNEKFQLQAIWSLGDFQVMHGTLGFTTATVKLISSDGEEKIACSVGQGPVDAAYKAINSIVQVPITLTEYMNTAMEGINAIASTQVVIYEYNNDVSMHASNGENHRRTFSGNGTGMDTVVSSVQAYLDAVNRMLGFKHLSAMGSIFNKNS